MRKQGSIREWRDRQGYGFIEPAGGGDDIFVHINAFQRGSRRPTVGTVVSYEEARDFDGRLRAENVALAPSQWALAMAPLATAGGTVFVLVVAATVAIGILPSPVLWLYLGMSVLTFMAYAQDKRAAVRNASRTAEDTLHAMALLGGWPGALYAQQFLRHKSRKVSFRVAFWLTVALNLAAFGYLVSDYGTWLVVMYEDLLR